MTSSLAGLPRPRPATRVAEAAAASRDGAARRRAAARAAGRAVAAAGPAAGRRAHAGRRGRRGRAGRLAAADRWLGSGRGWRWLAGSGWPGGWLLAGYLAVVFLALSASGLHRLRISLRVADQAGRIAAAAALPGFCCCPPARPGRCSGWSLVTAAALIAVRVGRRRPRCARRSGAAG